MVSMKAKLLVAAVLAITGPAVAAGVPAAAMNKTITISFTATGTGTAPDGTSRPFSTAVTRVIYVSSAGRLFMRHTATGISNGNNRNGNGGRPSRQGEFDPGDTRAGKGSFNFQGDKLVGVIPYGGGARQIVATFDSGFSSCSASVIEGNAGSGGFTRKGPDGVVRKITSASTSGASCSIQIGNAFAQ